MLTQHLYTLPGDLNVRLEKKTGHLYVRLGASSEWFFVSPEILMALIQISKKALKTEQLGKAVRGQMEDLLKNLPSQQEWKSIFQEMSQVGLLQSSVPSDPAPLHHEGFADPWVQWAMVTDRQRVDVYARALHATVEKQKSVVLDVGAGTGLLSALSLHAGAKKVYAIESSDSSTWIAPLLSSLKLPTQDPYFQLYKGHSVGWVAPEPIHVIVSELFGNDPLQEGVMPTFLELEKQWLAFPKPPICIPQKLEIFFEIMHILPNHSHYQRIAQWGNPGMQEDSFYNQMLHSIRQLPTFQSARIRIPLYFTQETVLRLGEPVCCMGALLGPNVGFYDPDHLNSGLSKKKQTRRTLPVIYPAVQNAVPMGILWFRVHLAPGITLSSHPFEPDACSHWSVMASVLTPEDLKKQPLSIHCSVDCAIDEVDIRF